MPTINGVLETALYVEDVERSIAFYQKLFGFPLMLQEERIGALNVADHQVLLLFKKGASTQPMPYPGGTIPPHDGSGNLHLAFAIGAEELKVWEDRLLEQQIPIESIARADRGGHSLYFRDPDHHLIELATPGLWPNY